MKKAAFAVVALAAAAVAISGCGSKTSTGIPNTVATVNGQNITASDYIQELHRRIGQDVLRSMIEQDITIQWAKNEKVGPTQDQINQQIEVLKREGVYEDQVKALGEDGLKNELEATQARINLAEKFYKPSDKDLEQAYNMMKVRYVHGPRKQVALIINPDKSQIDKAAADIAKGMKFEDAASKYTYRQFMMRGMIKLFVADDQPGLPADLVKAAKDTKVGDVSKSFALKQTGSPSQYVILKVLQEQPKADMKLKDVKDEIAGNVALQKAQMDPGFQKKLNAQKKKAKIDVSVPEFKDLVQDFKNPPDQMPMMMGGGNPGM